MRNRIIILMGLWALFCTEAVLCANPLGTSQEGVKFWNDFNELSGMPPEKAEDALKGFGGLLEKLITTKDVFNAKRVRGMMLQLDKLARHIPTEVQSFLEQYYKRIHDGYATYHDNSYAVFALALIEVRLEKLAELAELYKSLPLDETSREFIFPEVFDLLDSEGASKLLIEYKYPENESNLFFSDLKKSVEDGHFQGRGAQLFFRDRCEFIRKRLITRIKAAKELGRADIVASASRCLDKLSGWSTQDDAQRNSRTSALAP